MSGGKHGAAMHELLTRLWPLHRTLNSDDMERALEICGEHLNDERWRVRRYKPLEDAMTWYVPERFKVNEAWLEIAGERVADFRENPLHLLSYSLPKVIEGRLGDIRDHIWTRPDRPDAVPWEFKYYERDWGFCLRHSDLERFSDDDPVKGLIDTDFTDGDFCLGDFYIPGQGNRDLLFVTNICHPRQVNDSIAGLVAGLEMARTLKERPEGGYGFRLLVVPETIGTIVWMDRHPELAARVKYAWFSEMLGQDAPFILQLSRQGDSKIDRAFLLALKSFRAHGEESTGEFRKVVASDEIVTNGPGFDIPTPSLTRGRFPQYHTSDDSPEIIRPENLAEGLKVMLRVHEIMETDYYPRRTFTGPVMLSRYGLWVDWREDMELNLKTEAIMLMLEGDRSIIDIAYELGLPWETVLGYIDRFREADLIEAGKRRWEAPGPGGTTPRRSQTRTRSKGQI